MAKPTKKQTRKAARLITRTTSSLGGTPKEGVGSVRNLTRKQYGVGAREVKQATRTARIAHREGASPKLQARIERATGILEHSSYTHVARATAKRTAKRLDSGHSAAAKKTATRNMMGNKMF